VRPAGRTSGVDSDLARRYGLLAVVGMASAVWMDLTVSTRGGTFTVVTVSVLIAILVPIK
jgi:hypothetical protein